jgi:bifunctional non-homologous end joining protein LigD
MASRSSGETISIGGHQFRLTHPDKVMYPETGTTKADVIQYYLQIAPFMLPHVVGRPATRKRWVDGVGTPGHPGQVFFEKNLPDSAPSWIKRTTIQHKTSRNSYIVIDEVAALAWLGQMAALEIHVPQSQAGPRNTRRNPDRLVLDLDPGTPATAVECAEVALLLRDLVEADGLAPVVKSSGSKGLQVYAAIEPASDRRTSDYARHLAQTLEKSHPKLVVSQMRKDLRGGKVFVDWSQNNAAKTTVAPYALRARPEPWVSTPVTWDEVAACRRPDDLRFRAEQVLDRVDELGDLFAPLLEGAAPLP